MARRTRDDVDPTERWGGSSVELAREEQSPSGGRGDRVPGAEPKLLTSHTAPTLASLRRDLNPAQAIRILESLGV